MTDPVEHQLRSQPKRAAEQFVAQPHCYSSAEAAVFGQIQWPVHWQVQRLVAVPLLRRLVVRPFTIQALRRPTEAGAWLLSGEVVLWL